MNDQAHEEEIAKTNYATARMQLAASLANLHIESLRSDLSVEQQQRTKELAQSLDSMLAEA